MVARVTSPVAPTGHGVIDLMSVDEVIIQQARDAQAFARLGGDRVDASARSGGRVAV